MGNTAKSDKAKILKKIKEEYQDVFGEDTTNEIIMEAFEQFVSSEDDEQVDDDNDNVRKLAKQHQIKFVESISSTFKIMNGFEPSQDDISNIIDGIKNKFADEAKDDFLDQIVDEQDDDDEQEQEDDEI